MMSPTSVSLPCMVSNKDHRELNDHITFEISELGMEIYIRDMKLTVHLPLVDAQNVVDALKVLIDGTYDEEEDETDDDDKVPLGVS